MRPMRPGPRGKRGWRSAGNPSGLRNERAGGGLAGCRARMRGNDHEAQRRYIKEGGPFPASANRTRVCSASGARRGGPAHHPQNVAPLRMAGDPHFAHHCRVVAGAGPFVVFGDACPACSIPSGRTPEIVRNKRSLFWCPVRRRIARGAGEPPRAYSSWSSGSGVWPPSRRNSRRAASTSA